LLYVLKYLFWRKFHGLLRRMDIMQLLGEIFYRCLISSFGLQCHLIRKFLYWFFCQTYLFVRVEYWSHTLLFYWVLSVILCTVVFVLWNLVWWHLCIHVYNGYLFLMDCSLYQYEVTLSLLTNFGFKSALSDISIATPACFGALLA
jgi:hypothetical protein